MIIEKEFSFRINGRVLLGIIAVLSFIFYFNWLSQPAHIKMKQELAKDKPSSLVFCGILNSIDNDEYGELASAFSTQMIEKVFSSDETELIQCYLRYYHLLSTSLKVNIDRYIQRIFESQNLAIIERLLELGISPERKLEKHIRRNVISVYPTELVEEKYLISSSRYSKFGGRREVYRTRIVRRPYGIKLNYPPFLKTTTEIQTYLNDQGIDDNVHFNYGIATFSSQTPLQYAVQKNNVDYMKLLLKYNASVSDYFSEDDFKVTLKKLKPAIKKLLISANPQWSPNIKALLKGDIDAFDADLFITNIATKLLVDDSAQNELFLNLIDYDNAALLSHLLASNKLSLHKQDWYYLLLAYEMNSPKVLAVLLAEGIEVDTPVSRQDLPEQYQFKDTLLSSVAAFKSGDSRSVAEINRVQHPVGQFIAKQAIIKQRFSIAAYLGSQIWNWAPIHTASATGDLTTVQQLLALQPEKLNAVDVNGRTPLMLAIQYQHTVLSEWLVKSKSDLTIESTSGKSALHFAIDQRLLEEARMLLANGAPITTKKSPDCSSLAQYAIKSYSPYKFSSIVTRNYNNEEAREIYDSARALKQLAQDLIKQSIDRGLSKCAS